jgi:WD40 repeat protein
MPEAARSLGRPRRRLAWAAGGAVVIGLVVGAGWLASRGEELATLRGHRGPVRALAVDPELGYLLSAGDDGTVRAWDIRTNRLVTSSEPTAGKLGGLAVRPPFVFGVGTGTKVYTWNGPSLMPGDPFDLPVEAECLSMSADRRLLAVGGADGQVRLFTETAGLTPKAIKAHAKAVHCLTFTPDGSRLISGSSDGSIRLSDAAAGKVTGQLPVGNRKVHGLAVSPDGARLYAAVAGTGLRGWALDRREELPPFGGDAGMAWCVAVSPDGARLASGHEDGSVKVWQADPPALLHTHRGHRLTVTAVAFAPDGASVFSASGDGTVKRWKVPGR